MWRKRSAERRLHRGRVVTEGRKLLIGGLLLGQRVVLNGVDHHLGQLDVLGDVFQVGAVELPHEEELLRVPHDDGPNPGALEFAVLLNDGNDPAVEFAKLGVAFAHDLLAAGDIEEPGGFLEDDPLPDVARQRDDVLPGEARNQQARRGLQLDGLLGDIAQLEVSDFPGQGNVGRAVEEFSVLAGGGPRGEERGNLVDLLLAVLGQPRKEHQVQQGRMSRIFLGREGAVGGLHEEPLGLRLLQELGDLAFGNRAVEIEGFRIGRFHPVAQFGERLKEGGTEPHLVAAAICGRRTPAVAGRECGSGCLPAHSVKVSE